MFFKVCYRTPGLPPTGGPTWPYRRRKCPAGSSPPKSRPEVSTLRFRFSHSANHSRCSRHLTVPNLKNRDFVPGELQNWKAEVSFYWGMNEIWESLQCSSLSSSHLVATITHPRCYKISAINSTTTTCRCADTNKFQISVPVHFAETSYPIGSMYAIYTYIWHKFLVNVPSQWLVLLMDLEHKHPWKGPLWGSKHNTHAPPSDILQADPPVTNGKCPHRGTELGGRPVTSGKAKRHLGVQFFLAPRNSSAAKGRSCTEKKTVIGPWNQKKLNCFKQILVQNKSCKQRVTMMMIRLGSFSEQQGKRAANPKKNNLHRSHKNTVPIKSWLIIHKTGSP